MPHDLATANRHDHAWTENWAPNIWMLCMTLSPMRPRNAQRQSDRKDQLYETKGAWKNSPTCYALLNGGFMAILRRTDCFILIWTCNAVLAVSHHCHFSKLPPIQKQNPQKNKNVVCFTAMLSSNDAPKRCLWSCMVGLIQIQRPCDSGLPKGHGPRGCKGWKGAKWLKWVQKVHGLQDLKG